MRQTARDTLPYLLWMTTGALLLAAVLLSDSALAQTATPLGNVVIGGGHVGHVRMSLGPIGLGIAGVMILGVAAMAMFGRFKWSWLFAIIGSVALIAAEAHWGGLPQGTPGSANTQVGDFSRYVLSGGQRTELMQNSNSLALGTAQRSRQIGYAVAGLGAMGLATLAIFGRFRWAWLFALCGGLIILVGYASTATYISTQAPFPNTIVADQATMQLADGSSDAELFTQSKTLAYGTANKSLQVAYALAGLGILGLGTLAMLGRFQWRWFFAIVGGLAVIASLNEGLQYITG